MHTLDPVAPRSSRWDRQLLAVGVLAAVTTLVGLATAGFIADDWILLEESQRSWTAWTDGIDIRFRPIQAAYHGLSFDLLGAHPVAHLLVVAALQGVAAVLVVLVARRLFEPSTALLVGAVWAVLPNRGSTRLWIAAAPVTLAVILLLAGALAASSRPKRAWLATACCCAAVLTYEAGALIGLVVVIVAWRRPGDDRMASLTRAARGLVPYLAVVTWNIATSPKSLNGGAVRPLGIPDALFAHGLGPRVLGPVGVAVVVGALVAGVVLGLGGEHRSEVVRLTVGGLLVAAATSVPFAMAGFEQVAQGPGDRANAYAGLGVALVVVAALIGLWSHRRPLTAALAVTAGVLITTANVDDLVDVGAAGSEGARVARALTVLPDDLRAERLVLAPTTDHGGWIPFGYGSAARAATVSGLPGLRLRDPRYELGTVRPEEVVVRLVGDRLEVVPT